MNEMYDMSVVIHYYGVVGMLLVIFINILFLQRAQNIEKYKRQMSLFTPIASIPIGIVIFTGVIMMAAKHLDFTVENIVMIVFSILIIYLEAKRSMGLKYIDKKKEDALQEYKKYSVKLLFMEIVLTISISIWMLL